MTKSVDLFNEDLSNFIPQKQEKEEEKRITVYLPKSIVNNIEVLANNEDMKISPYIKERLIIPKLQEIADKLKREYEEQEQNNG